MMDLDLKPQHQSAINVIGGALTLGADTNAWLMVSAVLAKKLKPIERAILAVAILEATENEDFFAIIDAFAPSGGSGRPLPPLLDTVDEASVWASMASPSEVKAWLLACFVRLPAWEKRGFLNAAKKRDAA